MRTIKSFTGIVERIVDKNARLGMELTLMGNTMVCIDLRKEENRTRYVFDNGLVFSKDDIVSNIVKSQLDKKAWRIV